MKRRDLLRSSGGAGAVTAVGRLLDPAAADRVVRQCTFKLEKYTMKSLTRLAILSGVLAANLGCQSQAIVGLTANDEASLRQILDNEMKAANARDAAAWAAVYTEDAIVLRPHAPAVEGREAIQKWLATLPSISNAKGQGVEVMGYGDLAYLRGMYSMTFTIPGVPTPIDEQGKSADLSEAKRRFLEDDTRDLQLRPSNANASTAAVSK